MHLSAVQLTAMDRSDAESTGSWRIPSSDEEVEEGNDPIAPEPNEATRLGQVNILWQAELICRVRTGALTPLEREQMESVALPANLKQDMKKIISLYGKSTGAGAAWRRVLQHLMSNDQWLLQGQPVQVNSVYFPLLKHQLMAERSGFGERQEHGNVVGCSCLPATSLMLLGCSHKRLRIVDAVYLPHLLCQHCSLCKRCGLFLALG